MKSMEKFNQKTFDLNKKNSKKFEKNSNVFEFDGLKKKKKSVNKMKTEVSNIKFLPLDFKHTYSEKIKFMNLKIGKNL